MRILLSGLCLLAGLGHLEAQTAAGTAPAPRAARPSLAVQVTEASGKTIPDVAVRLTGTIAREGKTDASGAITFTNLRAGSFRLRFERDGFVTLERDVTLRATPPFAPVDVTLTAAPPPPKVEVPPPAPAPLPAATRPGVGEAKTTSVPTFVERNFIGRNEGKKESNVACMGTATAMLIQLRDPLPQHVHADADEMLYIVAGEATLKIDGREDSVDAGAFSSIPAGVAHSLTRRGRNPVIVLSMLSGAPCADASTK